VRQPATAICVYVEALARPHRAAKEALVALPRVIGLMLLAIGVALLVIGHNESQSPLEQLSETLTGRYSHETVWYLIGGTAAVVGGGALALFGARR
jgi:hypothetical protein